MTLTVPTPPAGTAGPPTAVPAVYPTPVPGGELGASRQAIKDMLPFVAALVPFSLAIGSASASAGMSAIEAIFGGAAILAGSSQLAAIELTATNSGALLIILIVALINLRFVFYGAGLARWFADAPLHRRLLFAITIIDQNFMLCQERFETNTDLGWRQRYYLTGTALLATTFLACQAIAFQIGAGLPDALGLHLAAPLAFAGMLAKAIKSGQDRVAGAAGAVTIVVGSSLIGAAALPLAVVVGVAAALLNGRRQS